MPPSRGGSVPSSPATHSRHNLSKRDSFSDVGAMADIGRIQALSKELFKHVKETETLIHKCQSDRQQAKLKAAGDFRAKVSARIKDSLDAVLAADESNSLASFCLSSLQHEHYALGARLMVCERRLELREGRPPQESKEDSLQNALFAEQEILNNAREAMLVLGGELMRKIDELTKVRNDIAGECAAIRREAALQEKQGSPMLSIGSSALNTPHSSVDSGRPPTPAEHKRFAERNTTLKNGSKRIVELQAEVEDLRIRTEALVSRSKQAADQAATLVNSMLSKRTNQVNALTRKMRTHVTDADFALLVAERALDRSVRKLDPDDAEALSRFAASKGMVEELRSTRKDLSEDLWRKTVGLNIDEACRKVTPQWAAGCSERAPTGKKAATGRSGGRTPGSGGGYPVR
eukprot:TRINITY_DN101685_c0_g1_i1.p1 TRINITY_DN101685_c0_g1~~TRINITY_DN101685_c0_g1_i1.p1  ORF type:complete len:405 (+),score=112.21 TRINITY_DN101685_c0_g1_i1:85-1299(+)